MMTSNRPLEDWGKLIGDVPSATAILDRFLHHAEVIAITGKSYRLRNQAGKDAATPPADDDGSKPAIPPAGSSGKKREKSQTYRSRKRCRRIAVLLRIVMLLTKIRTS